ncbi:MAG: DUF1559 domain-containing protein, partial [Fimbriiglobus sp.]
SVGCTFWYQILPYMEQDALFRNPVVSNPTVVKPFLEPGRGRPGHGYATAAIGTVPAGDFKTFPGLDYAVNLHALYGKAIPRVGAENQTMPQSVLETGTLKMAEITDGSWNTILVGGKALRAADYSGETGDGTFLDNTYAGIGGAVTAEEEAAPANQALRVAATSPLNSVSSVARCITNLPADATPANWIRVPNTVGGSTTPGYLGAGVVRDLDLVSEPVAPVGTAVRYANSFGGPYPGVGMFVFCDGHVQSLSYKWVDEDTDSEGGPKIPGTNLGAVLTPQHGETFVLE